MHSTSGEVERGKMAVPQERCNEEEKYFINIYFLLRVFIDFVVCVGGVFVDFIGIPT